jgi:mono/diheme cytochrome c family protein
VLPVLAALPLWALVYVGVLAEPAELVGEHLVGEQVFANSCAACHGPQGRGGVAPALDEPRLIEMFPEREAMIAFVAEGSVPGQPFGALGNVGTGAMPGFSAELTQEELAAVVSYVREALAGEEPPAEPEPAGDGAGAG